MIIFSLSCSRKKNTEKKVIEYMFPGGAAMSTIMERMKNEFMKKNTEYLITLTHIARWSEYQNKVITRIVGGNPPDIIIDAPNLTYDLYERGALYDLTEYIENDSDFGIIKNNLNPPEILNIGKIQGRYYSVPGWMNPQVLFYNKEIFTRHGVPYPPKDWSFKDFTKAVIDLTEKDQSGKTTCYGLLMAGSIEWLLPLNNSSIISKDGSKVTFNSKKSYDILKWYQDLVFIHKSAPKLVNSGEDNTGLTPSDIFQMGKAAMFIGNYSSVTDFIPKKNLSFDIVMLPRMVPEGKIFNNFICWMVLKNSKHSRGAFEFIKFLAGPDFQKVCARINIGVPILKSIQSSKLFLNPSLPPENKQAVINSLDYTFYLERYKNKTIKDNIRKTGLAFMDPKTYSLRSCLDEDSAAIKNAMDELKNAGQLQYDNY